MERRLPPPPPPPPPLPQCIARVAIASGRGGYTEEDQQEEREEGKTDRKNSGKKKTVGGSDGNEPIFSELEPDSSLETSSSSFYRAEPVLHNNQPSKKISTKRHSLYFIY